VKTIHFSQALTAANIDTVNRVIRGVSVITAGIIARGHALEVDGITLSQMLACAKTRGQVPVKIDHSSGAGAVCGYLSNFRVEGSKLLADWFLLESHPQTEQILETAQRMPRGIGLSAAFVSPDDAEAGKARCRELVSIDLVTLPAANPDGLFAAKFDRQQRPLTGAEKVRRVIGAAARGAEVGSLSGVVASGLLQKSRLPLPHANAMPMAGAVIGAVTNGALQYRRDKKRDLAARVSAIMLQDRIAVRRLTDAVSSNIDIPVPGADEVQRIATVAKKPLARRIALRGLKIAIGATAGHLAGKRIGAKAGALTGAVAGALFQSADVRNTVRLSLNHANKALSL